MPFFPFPISIFFFGKEITPNFASILFLALALTTGRFAAFIRLFLGLLSGRPLGA